MSNDQITASIRAVVVALEGARDRAAAGEVGEELDDLLDYAEELLDVVDEKLLSLNPLQHIEMFAGAKFLRERLSSLRREVRSS